MQFCFCSLFSILRWWPGSHWRDRDTFMWLSLGCNQVCVRLRLYKRTHYVLYTHSSHAWSHFCPLTRMHTRTYTPKPCMHLNMCRLWVLSYVYTHGSINRHTDTHTHACAHTLKDSDRTPVPASASMPLGCRPTADHFPSKSLKFPDAAEKWHVAQF